MSKATIELIHNARVLPMTFVESPRQDALGRFDGSVRYSDGIICDLGTVKLAGCQHDPVPPVSFDAECLVPTAGHHVFGGLLNNVHFGHFITESLVRLWAFDNLAETFNSVVFYNYSIDKGVPDFVSDTLDILIPGISVTVLNYPAMFELLAVPEELKFGSYIYGHPLNRDMCKRLRLNSDQKDIRKKIYISRSRLNVGNGGLIYEELIDDYMRAEGYAVLYPEAMSVREQLEAYSSAEKLVFADGSAVHLYALVSQPTQNVFVIYRRGKYSVYDWQIRTFGGPPVLGDSCIEEFWVPEKDPSSSFGKGVLNFAALSKQLFDAGFIAKHPWYGPNAEEVKARIAATMENMRLSYIQVPVPS